MSIDTGKIDPQTNAEQKMERNRLYILTGNKGGVGKSTIAVLTADFLIRHGKGDRLIIGDSELNDLQRTFYKIASKSGLIGEDQTRVWSMATDEGFEAFMDDVMAMSGQQVIVDTGANMLGLLTDQASFLAENLDEIGADACVIFVVGPGSESTGALKAYIKAVTKLEKPFRTHVVMMAPEDIPQEAYDLMKPESGTVRQVMEGLGIETHFLGKIPERFFSEIMRGDCLPPSKLLEKWNGKMAAKRFAAWLRDQLDPVLAKIAAA